MYKNNFLKNLYKIDFVRNMYLNLLYKFKVNKILKNYKNKKLSRSNKKIIYNFFGKINYKWHLLYTAVNNSFDKNYIPEDIFYTKIEPILNNFNLVEAYSDKNMYSVHFDHNFLPLTIIRNINGIFYDSDNKVIDIKKASEILQKNDSNFFIKPSIDTGGGKNVQKIKIINREIYLNGNIILFKELNDLYKKDYLIQKEVKQSKTISKIYPYSVNTIRIMTLFFENEVSVLSAVLRFGNNKSVIDNQAAGGISSGINKEGFLNNFAVDKFGNKYFKHPYTNSKFEGIRIPNYEKVIDFVSTAHIKFPYFRLISWDIALNEYNEPIFLEMNLKSQEINFHQMNNGPLFKEKTLKILAFCKII